MTAKAYLLKIRGGVEVDSHGNKAGKGPLIAEEISNTLGTSQDQYLFQPVAYGVVTKGNGDAFISKEKHTSLSTGGGQAGQGYPCVVLESHPNDSRVKIDDSGSIQTLTSRMGTDGAGHILAVLQGITTDNRTKRGRARIVSVPELESEYKRIDLAPVEIIRRGRK